ncbi:MAG: cytochrome c biogenesis protein CcsA [Planctomycetota bacterium]|nr:cytochrome c biogenesis protein CcsA [Planctomycetota bacterium]
MIPTETVGSDSLAWKVFKRLSSLKLTVVLFSLSLFLVLVGTLAQATEGLWTVINQYFRSFVVFIPIKAFVPPAWMPDGELLESLRTSPYGILFPGGKTIGSLLMINLVAAHVVRFKANGSRQAIGIGTAFIGVGLLLTLLTVLGASYADGIQDEPIVSYAMIWRSMLSAVIAMGCAMTGMVFFLKREQNLERILLIIGVALCGVAGIGLVILGSMYEQMESAMRIVWQLTQATVVGCVLLTGCALIFRNRGGIVLLHFGISLMMVNELFVGMYAVEERITVTEGDATEYAYNTQDIELAITQRGRDEDVVVSIPVTQLNPGNTISHDSLPFDVRIEAFLPNSRLQYKEQLGGIDEIEFIDRTSFWNRKRTLRVRPMAGHGIRSRAVEIPRVTGTAVMQKVDFASAYISILDAKVENALPGVDRKADQDVLSDSLLLSQHYSDIGTPGRDDGANAERIMVDGKIYEIALRFRRVRKPYELRLNDVKEASHHGSTKHKKFGSDFVITDLESGEKQMGSITMNNPLRYKGETFYQSGYNLVNTASGPVEQSTFQVVTNQGWMIPYIGCMYVVIGMLAQFGSGMLKFSERIQKRKQKKAEKQILKDSQAEETVAPLLKSELGQRRSALAWVIPLGVALLGLMTCYRLTVGSKTKSGEFDIKSAGGIPVSAGGRFQPIDSYARVFLRNSSDYESVSLTERQIEEELKGDRKRVYATEWLLDVITQPEMADEEYRIFRIYDPFLINKLGVQKKRKGYTYTYNEVTGNIDEFNRYVRETLDIQKADDGKSDKLSFQRRKALTLYRKIQRYEQFRNASLLIDTDSDEGIRKLVNEGVLFHPVFDEIQAASTDDDQLVRALADRVFNEERLNNISSLQYISRFAKPGTSLVQGQADSPLFAPTCDRIDIEVEDQTERLSLLIGSDHSKKEVNLGSIVRQADDHTVWKLINNRRSGPSEPSRELDWEIQPGMEVLTISTARVALSNFCKRHEIGSLSELTTKLAQLDNDYFHMPEDPALQNQAAIEYGNQQKRLAGTYIEKYTPAIQAIYQKVNQREATELELEKLKDQIARLLLRIKIEEFRFINQEYQDYLQLFYTPDLKAKSPASPRLQEIFLAYQQGETEKFNELVSQYIEFFNEMELAEYDRDKVSLELFYHYSAPLFQALIFYGVAALFVVLTWVFYGVSLDDIGVGMQRSALALLAIGSLIHTAGIVERVMITGKAPVTNLYASAVFISWGSVVCGFMIDLIVRYASPRASKLGIGALLGSIMGFVVIMVSFNLALRSDTFGKVEAVLDTQFWLATHVVCVTFGYVATFVAGALGILYLAGAAFSSVFDKEVRQGISWIIYGIVCFALLLSFFGTVLGGLWADDSWGRFWGWDPKENGALLIVIWNALILHARWGGMIRERGLAILALGGNIVTCWSWFGVNELGVGLHSYGFTEGVLSILCYVAIGHLAIITAAACVPTRFWIGYRDTSGA